MQFAKSLDGHESYSSMWTHIFLIIFEMSLESLNLRLAILTVPCCINLWQLVVVRPQGQGKLWKIWQGLKSPAPRTTNKKELWLQKERKETKEGRTSFSSLFSDMAHYVVSGRCWHVNRLFVVILLVLSSWKLFGHRMGVNEDDNSYTINFHVDCMICGQC